jgi:hypothetical protein
LRLLFSPERDAAGNQTAQSTLGVNPRT